MRHILYIITIMCLGQITIQAQATNTNAQKIDALNSALHFANESAHGMLIVHRMLENYNQDINKYVDLESYKINFYTNKDLPTDIFEDPENWFYDTSPYEWYDIAVAKSEKSKYTGYKAVIEDIGRMRTSLSQINRLRFDLDKLIIDKDLTDRVALDLVYAKLEEGVTLYEDYYKKHLALLDKISKAFKPLTPSADDVQFPALYSSMKELYMTTRKIMEAVREKEDENMVSLIAAQKKAIDKFKKLDLGSFGSTRLTSSKMRRYKKNIDEQSSLSIKSIKRFYETADVPEEYKQYGKFYYYYNSDLINKFNRYGNGIVFEMNNVTNYLDIPVLLFTEMPHYFKVIYPKKLEKVEHLAASDSKITKLPSKLKDRELQMSTRTIKVDSAKFVVALYDHMVVDGDVISLNFNGDWIIEKMPLTEKKQELKLQLNTEGKNYFILHAENEGRRPPNTMAVDYYYQGVKQQIILKSNMNVSEMIEIEFVQE